MLHARRVVVVLLLLVLILVLFVLMLLQLLLVLLGVFVLLVLLVRLKVLVVVMLVRRYRVAADPTREPWLATFETTAVAVTAIAATAVAALSTDGSRPEWLRRQLAEEGDSGGGFGFAVFPQKNESPLELGVVELHDRPRRVGRVLEGHQPVP